MAFDMFLKLDGIDGDSTDADHKAEIVLSSYSLGSSNFVSRVAASGAAAGKVTFQDIHFTMSSSSASPQLMLACASGKHLSSGVLTCRKAGGQEFLKITLTDCIVSSYQTGGSASQDVPVDQVSLNFLKIETDFQPVNPDGRPGTLVSGAFDLLQNAVIPPQTIG